MPEERKRPGPTRRVPARQEYHVKLDAELAAYVQQAATHGFQAFFEQLVRSHKEQAESQHQFSSLRKTGGQTS